MRRCVCRSTRPLPSETRIRPKSAESTPIGRELDSNLISAGEMVPVEPVSEVWKGKWRWNWQEPTDCSRRHSSQSSDEFWGWWELRGGGGNNLIVFDWVREIESDWNLNLSFWNIWYAMIKRCWWRFKFGSGERELDLILSHWISESQNQVKHRNDGFQPVGNGWWRHVRQWLSTITDALDGGRSAKRSSQLAYWILLIEWENKMIGVKNGRPVPGDGRRGPAQSAGDGRATAGDGRRGPARGAGDGGATAGDGGQCRAMAGGRRRQTEPGAKQW